MWGAVIVGLLGLIIIATAASIAGLPGVAFLATFLGIIWVTNVWGARRVGKSEGADSQ
jgi:threonine/homoserine efflux transporter RhtA